MGFVNCIWFIPLFGVRFSHCFFSLLPSKTEVIYLFLINNIKKKLNDNNIILNSREIMIDFECAAFKSLRFHFPDATIRGCYIHFDQAIWRKVMSLGLKNMFTVSKQFKTTVTYISALSLIPIHKIFEVWDIIINFVPRGNIQIDQFLDYVYRTWIDNNRATFHWNMWSHYDNNGARTNNAVEGFHFKSNSAIETRHIDIYIYIGF